jgi:hypothetical protein
MGHDPEIGWIVAILTYWSYGILILVCNIE